MNERLRTRTRTRTRTLGCLVIAAFLAAGPACGGETGPEPLPGEGLTGWTKNPSLEMAVGLWDIRTFCWAIGEDCPDDLLLTVAEWVDDGDIFLHAEDDNTDDIGVDCAAITQGTDFGDNVHGDPLEPLRVGDMQSAYILLRKSDSGATECSGITGAGNIINLWLEHPDGARWVTDFYFETEGINAGFGERAGLHNSIIAEEKGVDWYAYQLEVKEYPEYWTRRDEPDGSEYWSINLKMLLDRGAAFSERDLSDYRLRYVDVISENVCIGGEVGESAAWWRIHYFEITYEVRDGAE